jgi:multidrug efflux system outer membrane protein
MDMKLKREFVIIRGRVHRPLRFATPSKGVVAALLRVPTLFFGLLVLASCKLGPDYHAPDMLLPSHWLESKKVDEKNTALQEKWWKQFHDPVLDDLITRALKQNFDLQIAKTHIEQARAVMRASRSDLFPVGSMTASATREANLFQLGNLSFPAPFNLFQAGFDASWEADLFGGNKRALESSTALFKASKANRDDVRVSLLAEVARSYVEIRKLQAQIAVANAVVASEQKNVSIRQELFTTGNTAETDAIAARTELLKAQSQLLDYQDTLVIREYALDVLLGEKPGYVKSVTGDARAIPVADKNIVMLAPADVIANRPDIRAADRELAASTAEIGVAKAKLFPDISLSGFFGFLSTDTDKLLQANSKSWSLGGNLLWPVFNYGKLSAGVAAVKAQTEEALLNYKKTVLAALADVESSLSSYNKAEETRLLADKAVAENLHGVTIADMRYKSGVTSLVDVIVARRALYSAQIQAANTAASSAEGFIAVYKSLGGGWKQPEEPKQAPKKS